MKWFFHNEQLYMRYYFLLSVLFSSRCRRSRRRRCCRVRLVFWSLYFPFYLFICFYFFVCSQARPLYVCLTNRVVCLLHFGCMEKCTQPFTSCLVLLCCVLFQFSFLFHSAVLLCFCSFFPDFVLCFVLFFLGICCFSCVVCIAPSLPTT